MKKLIFILLFFYPVFLFAQQHVTLKSGQQFDGYISGVLGNNLVFYQKIKEIESKKVHIMLIHSISGEIHKPTTIKALTKKNPKIIFDSTFVSAEKDNSYQVYDQSKKLERISGDYFQLSAKLRLSGLALSSATATAIWAGAFSDDLQTQKTVAIAAGIASLILYVSGEAVQIKAGKLLKSEIIILTPASQGIGLAINF